MVKQRCGGVAWVAVVAMGLWGCSGQGGKIGVVKIKSVGGEVDAGDFEASGGGVEAGVTCGVGSEGVDGRVVDGEGRGGEGHRNLVEERDLHEVSFKTRNLSPSSARLISLKPFFTGCAAAQVSASACLRLLQPKIPKIWVSFFAKP